MIVRNPNTLIGDFIGTIPAMQALPSGTKFVIADEVTELFNMTGLTRCFGIPDIEFDLHAAFALADRQDLHMIQANFAFVGLAIPEKIPYPKLNYPLLNATQYDYCLAPFSRSLPYEQKWNHWQSLVDAMPDKSFCVLGAKSDPIDYIRGANVTPLFGQTMSFVCNLLEQSKLISVVTGISHLAHAIGAKNYLLCNQGRWGKNPDAIVIEGNIPYIGVDKVLEVLNAND